MGVNLRLCTIFAVVVWALLGAQAQVTFSRDWNPGKRVMENQDVHGAMKTASTICHLLINQVRQLATCENRAEELDPGTAVFGGGR